MGVSKRKFKTEVQQLLDLVIHSLYTNKDIFLRELVSNASDAVDRLRFEALSDKALLDDQPKGRIKIIPDKEARTITVSDNGIGMTRDEVETNIGTIANSGTRAFLEQAKEGKIVNAPELIGQFGVGFYASFMVADKVTLVTRKAGQTEAVTWTSGGDGTYTLEECEKATHGTDVTLHLNEGMEEFLEEWKIRKIIKQYSDFVEYPVVMDITREEVPRDEEGKPIEGAEAEKKTEEQTLNSMKALWMRPKNEITDEQYHEFYKHISHDYVDPLTTIHYAAEGTLEFRAVLFLPAKAPFDLFMREEKHGLHLYVRRIFISDECDELLPEYLRFVKGVVESNDLPLNVSRELLQENAIVRKIQKSITAKILSTLKEMKEKQEDDYLKFWREFGKVLKEGLRMDFANREKLEELLLFESTHTKPGAMTTLQEYVDRMPEGQEAIYYIIGDEREILETSPHLEACRKRGYEVLFMTDSVDEWVIPDLGQFKEKTLKAVDRGEIAVADEDEKKQQQEKLAAQTEQYKALLEFCREQLKEEVADVKLSARLTDSVSCLVAGDMGMSANMERIFRRMNQEFQPTKRTLELNPDHPLLAVMQQMAQQDPRPEQLSDYVELVHDQALLAEGMGLKNPARFAQRVSELMVAAQRGG